MKTIKQFLKWYNKPSEVILEIENKIWFWAGLGLVIACAVKILQMNGFLIVTK